MKKMIWLLLVVSLGIAGYWGYRNWRPDRSQEGEAVTRVKTAGVLTVGTDATYPPLEYLDEQGTIVGFDPDLAKTIAADLGVRLELKNVSFDNIFAELETGKLDLIISSVTITPERLTKYAFSSPYFNAGQVVVVAKDSPIKSSADLRGRKVGAQVETTSLAEAAKLTESEMVIGYADYAEASQALRDQKIEAIIIDYPAGVGLVMQYPDLKVVGEPFTQEFYGIVARKGDSELLTQVNATIAELKRTDAITDLRKQWKLE